MTSLARDVRVASWARSGALRLVALQAGSFQAGVSGPGCARAGPVPQVCSLARRQRPVVYHDLFGTRRALTLMGSLRRPVALQAGVSYLVSLAQDAQDPALSSKLAACPAGPRPVVYHDLLGTRRARSLMGPPRRPVALQAGALQEGVSGS